MYFDVQYKVWPFMRQRHFTDFSRGKRSTVPGAVVTEEEGGASYYEVLEVIDHCYIIKKLFTRLEVQRLN